jgi:hypothetical protein
MAEIGVQLERQTHLLADGKILHAYRELNYAQMAITVTSD